VLFSGCATQTKLVSKMFRSRTGCTDFVVRSPEKNHHDVEGCGMKRAYQCKTEFDSILCEEIIEQNPQAVAIDLVSRLHRSRHECAGVSVVPLGGADYEARGCGPVLKYRCTDDEGRVFCEPASQ
jgi:hypothetical protein